VAEARDSSDGGSGGGAATDQRRANMKEQFQWNSNLKCQCQRKLVRKTKNMPMPMKGFAKLTMAERNEDAEKS